jgi:CHAD domain-containing protein
MTGREQTEIERKYDVEGLSRIPDLAAVDGVTEVVSHEPVILTAVYYDTLTHDLARRRIVLRRREGGGDAGWHIKLPAAEGRTELHWPLDLSESEVPAAVLEPVRAIVRDRPLTPLARITTVRTAIRLHGADGSGLAEVADDVVSASDARGGTYRKWREWEVELLGGAPDTRSARTRLLDAIEKEVLAAGARTSSSVAKIARAVGVDSLTDVAPPTVLPGLLPAPALNDPESVAVIVVGAVRELVQELLRSDPLARADAADAIHGMRTTVRRLRSVLAVYSRLFDKTAVADLRLELEHLGIELGRARDVEVRGRRAAAELAGVSDPNADAETRLVGGARLDHADGLERVRSYLVSTRYYRLLDALDAFAEWPPLTAKAARAAGAEISRDLRKAISAVGTATARVAEADDPDAALHGVRKAVRRLRYAAEAVAVAEPVAPGAAAPTMTTAKTAKATKITKKARKQAKAKRAAAAARLAKLRRRYAEIGAVAKPLVKRLGNRHDRLLYIAELERAAQAAHEAGENTMLYGLLIARAEDLDDTVPAVLADARRTLHRLERLGRAL